MTPSSLSERKFAISLLSLRVVGWSPCFLREDFEVRMFGSDIHDGVKFALTASPSPPRNHQGRSSDRNIHEVPF